jgi:glycosyltransferase involved in cell wall biosynthesis
MSNATCSAPTPAFGPLNPHSSNEDPPIVGIIIPMYNAALTIDRTLRSVCAQTYRNLEIIVVDDGSTDGSASRVNAWIEREPRIRLISQANSGVAAARNLGASCTLAEYLAFIDADDLWAPEKIELQFAALLSGGDAVGLAYSWFAYIDEDDQVLSLAHQPDVEGQAFQRMLRTHVVGNGSSAIFRRTAFEHVGGFDPMLRNSGAEGCEDLAICLRVAEHYEIRVVRRHLVGYRILPNNMSSDPIRMLRSCALVLSEYRRRFPQFSADIDEHLEGMRYWSLLRAATTGHYRPCYELAKQMWRANGMSLSRRVPHFLLSVSRSRAPRFLRRAIRRVRPRLRYSGCSW